MAGDDDGKTGAVKTADKKQGDAKGAKPQAPDAKQQDASKPKNGHDGSPKTGADAKDDKKDAGVDASPVGQSLGKIISATHIIKGAQPKAEQLMLQSQKTADEIPDEKIAADLTTLLGGIKPAQALLDDAWFPVHEYVTHLMSVEHHPEKEAKSMTLEHPGMQQAMHDLTYATAHLLSATSGVQNARPTLKMQASEANRLLSPLQLLQGNLGLPVVRTFTDVMAMVEIKVSVPVVDLGTGGPRDQIQEHVISMAVSWNNMIQNMAHGLEKFVRTMDQTSMKEAPGGLMDKVWDKALEMVKKGAKIVSGTELAADIGLQAINKILDYGKAMEEARINDDQETFIAGISKRINALQIAGAEGGGGPKIHAMVDALDKEFAHKKPEDPDDKWKQGDHAVVGDQAVFLKDLEQKATAYDAAVPTIEGFETTCLVEFVNASHKMRNNSAWRSPLEGAQSMDGYVRVDLELGSSGTWWLNRPAAGKLHCPKSSGVAKELTNNLGGDLSMWSLGTPLVLRITADAVTRKEMPEMYGHNPTTEIAMDGSKMIGGAPWLNEYWNWIMSKCGTSTYDVLSQIRKLEG